MMQELAANLHHHHQQQQSQCCKHTALTWLSALSIPSVLPQPQPPAAALAATRCCYTAVLHERPLSYCCRLRLFVFR
jgi:hypothetical protein